MCTKTVEVSSAGSLTIVTRERLIMALQSFLKDRHRPECCMRQLEKSDAHILLL